NRESIAAFFGQSNRRGYAPGLLGYSRVIELSGQLIAAIMVRADRINLDDEADGLVVQPIMVAAEYQRHGLGRCLLGAVRIALAEDDRDYLNSRCHLGNADSMAWHRAVGFEEQPSLFSASHRAHHHRWMAGHHAAAGRELESFYHAELAEAYAQLRAACEQIQRGKHHR
ncbi:MAG: GNAT family N-acetyltransferase, partial [Aureliella sp.]